jgi:hypothetical protein
MKHQGPRFVNPFSNIYSKIRFCVAGLSLKPFSRIDTLRFASAREVPENPAPEPLAEDLPDQLAAEAKTMPRCSYSLASISSVFASPAGCPLRLSPRKPQLTRYVTIT